jgi:glycosyltransferase involved in cell wall biosynthesis
MDFKILTYNNRVGIVYDSILLNNLLTSLGTTSSIKYIDEMNFDCKSTFGIWIQNYDEKYFSNFKYNIFFINEEWVTEYDLNLLKKFDIVVCKTNHAKELLKQYCSPVVLPFISRNLFDRHVERSSDFLHFKGRSIQKNTELVLDVFKNKNIHIIDSNRQYESNESISYLLNSHKIHVCISLYESWGHYLFEGLSTGNEIICTDIPSFTENLDPELVYFIPTKIKKDSNYMFDCDDRFFIRESFHADRKFLIDLLEDFKPIGKNEDRRKLFNNIIEKNTNRLTSFFKNI